MTIHAPDGLKAKYSSMETAELGGMLARRAQGITSRGEDYALVESELAARNVGVKKAIRIFAAEHAGRDALAAQLSGQSAARAAKGERRFEAFMWWTSIVVFLFMGIVSGFYYIAQSFWDKLWFSLTFAGAAIFMATRAEPWTMRRRRRRQAGK